MVIGETVSRILLTSSRRRWISRQGASSRLIVYQQFRGKLHFLAPSVLLPEIRVICLSVIPFGGSALLSNDIPSTCRAYVESQLVMEFSFGVPSALFVCLSLALKTYTSRSQADSAKLPAHKWNSVPPPPITQSLKHQCEHLYISIGLMSGNPSTSSAPPRHPFGFSPPGGVIRDGPLKLFLLRPRAGNRDPFVNFFGSMIFSMTFPVIISDS